MLLHCMCIHPGCWQWIHIHVNLCWCLNTIMDKTGSPPYTWLLRSMYACFVCDHTASSLLKNRAPLEVLTGSTPNICPLLRFSWWSPIYYSINEDAFFGSDSAEKHSQFVVLAEHVGHAMTCKILTEDTFKIINCSSVCDWTGLDGRQPDVNIMPPRVLIYSPWYCWWGAF